MPRKTLLQQAIMRKRSTGYVQDGPELEVIVALMPVHASHEKDLGPCIDDLPRSCPCSSPNEQWFQVEMHEPLLADCCRRSQLPRLNKQSGSSMICDNEVAMDS